MQSILDTFFSTVRNEFGDKINFSNIECEGFNGIVCINDNSADITIRIDDCQVYENDLSGDENRMLDAFISYTQKEMKKQKSFIINIKLTEKMLHHD